MLRAKLSKLSMPTKSHFSCHSLLTKTKTKKEFAPVAKPKKKQTAKRCRKNKKLEKTRYSHFPGKPAAAFTT